MTDIIAKLQKPNLTRRFLKRIRSYFFFEQWILLLTKDFTGTMPSWSDFTRILPPTDRFWADPFLWVRDENYFIFFEEYPFSTKRGVIACVAIDENLKVTDKHIVLERPYHLSYPFLFEYNNQLYMIPETGENKTIEMYRCTEFPHRWEFFKTLMTNVPAFDATLIEYREKWWLFVNIAEKNGSTWDTLHLFYADHPLSEHWTPHPLNPIVQDIKTARPAGNIISDAKGLIRPSQNCSVRYGYATNFNRIIKLSETEYAEIIESSFLPKPNDILGVHTWNKLGNMITIDATLRRRKYIN